MESIIPQEQKEALMEAELLVNNNPQILVEGEFLDGQEVTNEKNLLENILCTILEKAIEGTL